MPNQHETALLSLSKYDTWKYGQTSDSKDITQMRGNLFMDTAALATEKGLPYFVADGTSSPDFKAGLSSQSSVHVLERAFDNQTFAFLSSLDQIDRSIKTIISLQGEKTDILYHADAIAAPINEGRADLVIPRRNERLFKATYPDYMYESETMANSVFNSALDAAGLKDAEEFYDMFLGVIAWKHTPEIESKIFAPYILSGANKDTFTYGLHRYVSPGVYVFYITSALASGLRVQSVEIPFDYGKQKENEILPENREIFTKKRIAQRRGILIAECMAIAEIVKKRQI